MSALVLRWGTSVVKAIPMTVACVLSVAYSDADVRAMTEAFSPANPDVKVNLEFVPYEGLHDKTVLSQGSGSGYDVVLFDVIWPAEYAQNNVLVDVTDRVTSEMKEGVLPGAWTTVEFEGKRYGMQPLCRDRPLRRGSWRDGRRYFGTTFLLREP